MKSSPLIWRYVVNIKLMVKISSIFVAFLENMNLPKFSDTLTLSQPTNAQPKIQHIKMLVTGLVICFYLGWSGSTLLITKHINKGRFKVIATYLH